MPRTSNIDTAAVNNALEALHQQGVKCPSANKVREFLKQNMPNAAIGGQKQVHEIVLKWRENKLELRTDAIIELSPMLSKAIQAEIRTAVGLERSSWSEERDALMVDLLDQSAANQEQEERIFSLGDQLASAVSEKDAAIGGLEQCRQSLDRSQSECKQLLSLMKEAELRASKAEFSLGALGSERESLLQQLLDVQLALAASEQSAELAASRWREASARAESAEALVAALRLGAHVARPIAVSSNRGAAPNSAFPRFKRARAGS